MVTSFNDFASVPGQAGSDGMSAEWRTGAFETVGGQMKFQTKHAGVLDFGGASPATGFCLLCLWWALLTAGGWGSVLRAEVCWSGLRPEHRTPDPLRLHW